jgi:hypothetical protein
MPDAARQLARFAVDLTITATDLAHMVQNVDPRYIHYAYAGGAHTYEASHTGHMLLAIAKEEVESEGAESITQRGQAVDDPQPDG